MKYDTTAVNVLGISVFRIKTKSHGRTPYALSYEVWISNMSNTNRSQPEEFIGSFAPYIFLALDYHHTHRYCSSHCTWPNTLSEAPQFRWLYSIES